MTQIHYDEAPAPVRGDLAAAHQRAWERLAAPGTWWTGAERVAIAAEVRAAWGCALCAERKAALSPGFVDGEHDTACGDTLSDVAIDSIHRITTDPGRLSRAWYEKTQAAGLPDTHYVELLGVLVTVLSIDAFCLALGVPPHPLPEPRAGSPSQRRPEGALAEGAFVPMIKESRALGAEADLYDGMPRTGNVLRALSLVPEEVRQLKELGAAHYLAPAEMMDLDHSPRAIDRMQIELIAGRVSALRECFY